MEDTLYNLHRSLLERHSPIFREMFLVPQPDGSTEGLSEDHPIMLSGICAINFTRLLWLLYPPYVVPFVLPEYASDIYQCPGSLQGHHCRRMGLNR